MFNAMLLVLCKQLKLEAGYSPTNKVTMLCCIKQTAITCHLVLCAIVSIDMHGMRISLLWSNQPRPYSCVATHERLAVGTFLFAAISPYLSSPPVNITQLIHCGITRTNLFSLPCTCIFMTLLSHRNTGYRTVWHPLVSCPAGKIGGKIRSVTLCTILGTSMYFRKMQSGH